MWKLASAVLPGMQERLLDPFAVSFGSAEAMAIDAREAGDDYDPQQCDLRTVYVVVVEDRRDTGNRWDARPRYYAPWQQAQQEAAAPASPSTDDGDDLGSQES